MRILITGAAGTIGHVLMKCLNKKYDIIGIDKKPVEGVTELDLIQDNGSHAIASPGRLSRFPSLRGVKRSGATKQSIDKFGNLLHNIDVVIHLAWNVEEAGGSLTPVLQENKKMGEEVFQKALEKKVSRVIFASSVHASFGLLPHREGKIDIEGNHKAFHREQKITVDDGFYPLGVYGASKVYLEALGKAYSTRGLMPERHTQGLQVIAVRFGNVTPDDNHGEYPFWLSHRDCCQFIEKCITSENLSEFSTFFAISNNACNPFDILNAKQILGYKPQDGTRCPKAHL